jgi:PadR family transcriptional regulator PadR
MASELTRLEEQILLTVWRLRDEAYGIAIYDHINTITGKNLAIGGIYYPLERLVKQGYLKAEQGEPTPIRGGKSKRYYRLTEFGIEEMLKSKRIQDAFWEGINLSRFAKEESK